MLQLLDFFSFEKHSKLKTIFFFLQNTKQTYNSHPQNPATQQLQLKCIDAKKKKLVIEDLSFLEFCQLQ